LLREREKLMKVLQYLKRHRGGRVADVESAAGKEHSRAVVGIEIEVEQIRALDPEFVYWEMKTDGSLRNRGKEFVSRPLDVTQIQPAFEELLSWFSARPNTVPDFSWRTSTHVHLNVQQMDMAQVGMIGLLEVVFSKVFFSFIQWDREKSNFCVPNAWRKSARKAIYRMLETHPSMQIGDVEEWEPCSDRLQNCLLETSKYSSLNFLPICRFGTIEFRHFHGAYDISRLFTWLDFIVRLHDFVTSSDFDFQGTIKRIQKLNTHSDYEQFVSFVLGEENAAILKCECRGSLDEFLKIGCTKAKQLLLEGKKPSFNVLNPRFFKGGKKFFESKVESARAEVVLSNTQDFAAWLNQRQPEDNLEEIRNLELNQGNFEQRVRIVAEQLRMNQAFRPR
jgi:hypothetical protein